MSNPNFVIPFRGLPSPIPHPSPVQLSKGGGCSKKGFFISLERLPPPAMLVRPPKERTLKVLFLTSLHPLSGVAALH
jgi:hypothetical protein